MAEKFRRELAVRFIKDEGLPIRIPESSLLEGYFYYALGIYEEEYGARTKWDEFCEYLKEHSSLDYLGETNAVSNRIIDDFKDNPDYIEFTKSDMSKFAVDFTGKRVKDIYNCNNSGKIFLSIDLKKANFQALKHVGVIKENTYEEWISKYTDVPMLFSSKHLRVLTFGHLCPNRQVTVEKYLTSQIVSLIDRVDLPLTEKDIVSINNDEAVWVVEKRNLDCFSDLDGLCELIKKELGLDVKIELFKLQAYELIQDISKTHIAEVTKNAKVNFFEKENIITGIKTYHCIPSRYHMIITNMLHDKELSDKQVSLVDRLFIQDDFVSELCGGFELRRI